ncbi:hypothetical protein V8C86DRAFT_2646145 [Haematococcus lacustris]
MIVAVHLAHVPGTDAFLYMERPSGYHPDGSRQIAGTLDLVSRRWVHVDTPDGLFCCGHTQTADGQVAVVGGHQLNAGFPSGMRTLRLFNMRTQPTRLLNTSYMAFNRWYPTPTLMPSGVIIVMGGTQAVGAGSMSNPRYEIFDPRQPFIRPVPQRVVEPTYLATVKQNFYPFNFVLPTSDMFNFCARVGRILQAETGIYRSVSVPTRPGIAQSQFPYTATAVLLALRPETWDSQVEVVIFGGAPVEGTRNESTIAGRTSHRMVVSFNQTAGSVASYRFPGGWVAEDMGIPRVMGDATLLPNGDVVLLNGGQRGVAGDAAVGGGARSTFPAFWAQLYQPDLPVGNRYTTLAASQIARMYHSTAALTTNGTILVSGCDRCGKLVTNAPFHLPPPVKAEYRNEIFYPPYWFDTANKPAITSMNGNTNVSNVLVLGYGEDLVLTWSSFLPGSRPVPVTAVSIVAPSSVTHSFNFNQRVVFLPIVRLDSDAGYVRVTTPPTPSIAVPQFYMLFIMNGKTYSSAWWIQLVDRAAAS